MNNIIKLLLIVGIGLLLTSFNTDYRNLGADDYQESPSEIDNRTFNAEFFSEINSQ